LWKKSQFVGRKSQLVVLNQVVTNACCGLAVIFWGFISFLIGRETINIPEIFSGVQGFTGMTVKSKNTRFRELLQSKFRSCCLSVFLFLQTFCLSTAQFWKKTITFTDLGAPSDFGV